MSNQNELLVESCTLKDFLLSHQQPLPQTKLQGKICIPEYQRPYIWKERQVSKLLTDLVAYKNNIVENKPLYYLGSIIIHHDGDNLKIIDGQQRITTMLILQSLAFNQIYSNIAYHSPVTIENIKYNHSYLKAIFEKRLTDYQHISTTDIVDFSQINVTLVITNSEDLAYTFFETQNTGGVRLNGTDIAKAHHLRAIDCKKMVAHQAKRWESIAAKQVQSSIMNLIKIRFWNNMSWNNFPFYRDEVVIKETLIEELTENTQHSKQDISHYYTIVKREDGRCYVLNESDYRQIRQPLYDGKNFMDYVNEYVELHQSLFINDSDYRIPDSFYEFRNRLLHGKDGTIFLKELMEIALLAYVSRFGFSRLLEFSLWMYRMIYSMRVSFDRNVREDSIFKFVYKNSLMDLILASYTIDDLIASCKRYSYSFNDNYIAHNQSKGKHVQTVKEYFNYYGLNSFTTATEMYSDNLFDKILITNIHSLIQKQNI
jgi:hypothetical protein